MFSTSKIYEIEILTFVLVGVVRAGVQPVEDNNNDSPGETRR